MSSKEQITVIFNVDPRNATYVGIFNMQNKLAVWQASFYSVF